MNSIILRTTSRVILPAALLFSVYILLRGHNNPGGGFIGGLIAAAGIAVHALANGPASLPSILHVSPKVYVGAGLMLAIVSGLPALLLAEPFLTHQWLAPAFGLGTTLVFDAGIYLTVVGAVLTFLSYYLEE